MKQGDDVRVRCGCGLLVHIRGGNRTVTCSCGRVVRREFSDEQYEPDLPDE